MVFDNLDDLDVIKEAEEIARAAFRERFIPVLLRNRELENTVEHVTNGIWAYLGGPKVRSRGLEVSPERGVFRLSVYFQKSPDLDEKKEEKFSELKQRLESYEYMHGASGRVESIQPYGEGYELTMHFYPP